MLKIQIISDTHIEFYEGKKLPMFFTPSAPILALLGDICCAASDADFTMYKNYIKQFIPLYEHIIIVSGNHEYFFNGDEKNLREINCMKKIDSKIKAFCRENKKLHFLNNSSIYIKLNGISYCIIGSTLWSDIDKNKFAEIKDSMNDYQFIFIKTQQGIRRLLPQDVSKLFSKNVKYLRKEIDEAKKKKCKIIVLSHHMPYLTKIYGKGPVDSAYMSDLTYMFGDICLWGYGHTHKYDYSKQGNTILYSNPKGYPGQKTGFKKNEMVQI